MFFPQVQDGFSKPQSNELFIYQPVYKIFWEKIIWQQSWDWENVYSERAYCQTE
jgi:hypothetical protein